MQFKTIKSEEYEKYREVLTEYGFSEADFSLAEETAKTKTPPDDIEPKGGIIITCRANQQRKTYPTATGHPWTKTFEHDLKTGFFNR